MTLQELYSQIQGDYDKAMQVLRMEKLLDKHIRKLPANSIFGDLAAAGESMDANALFENAHAVKGVCANLGLVKLSALASDIAEEFRPGNARRLTDAQVKQILNEIDALYQKTASAIEQYTLSA